MSKNRKQVHKQQIEWLLDKGHHPVVFHQDYDDDEFLPNVNNDLYGEYAGNMDLGITRVFKKTYNMGM